MNSKEKYIHGFSDDEQARLTRMQDILNQAQLAALDLSNVRRVLDVGSGLGQMTRAIARNPLWTGTVRARCRQPDLIGVIDSAMELLDFFGSKFLVRYSIFSRFKKPSIELSRRHQPRVFRG